MASKRKYESEFDSYLTKSDQDLFKECNVSPPLKTWCAYPLMALPEISLTSVWHLKNGQDRRLAEFLNNKYLREATERRVLQYAVK